MIELEPLQKAELEIENEALREDNKKLTHELIKARLEIEKLKFELKRKPRREFVAAPFGN